LFGTGIEPSSFTVGLQTDYSTDDDLVAGLVLTDGSSSLNIPAGLSPNAIGTLTFVDTGAETLTQLMNADVLGTEVFSMGAVYNDVLSGGSNSTVTNDGTDTNTFAFGNQDTISDTYPISSYGDSIYAYGNNDSILGYSVWAGGNDDQITLNADSPGGAHINGATLVGANNTVVAGFGNETFAVYNSSSVI